MIANIPFNNKSTVMFVLLVLSLFTNTNTHAADANLNMTFTTTNAGGSYGNRHVHVVWIKDSSGNFIYTVGATTTDNKRALWANRRAYSLTEWYNSNPTTNRTDDIAARTGATQTAYQTYNLNWNWRRKDGSVVPDGNYQIHFLCTNSDSGSPNNKTSFNITKGSSPWSLGPVSQGGYNNISLSFTPAGLGIDAKAATSVSSYTAIANGEITAVDGDNPNVYLYWGKTDGQKIATNWTNEIHLGVQGVGTFLYELNDLTPLTTYYYRWRAVTANPIKDIWSEPISFTTTTPDTAQIDVNIKQVSFNQVATGESSDINISIQSLGSLPLSINSLNIVGLESDVFTIVNAPALPAVLDIYQPGVSTEWDSQDVGSVSAAGSVEFGNTTITIQGSGSDIWGEDDEFYFTYQTLTGDGEIIARIDSLENTNGWAKAGVMMRNSLGDEEVRNAFMAITPENGTTFQWRNDEETSSSHTNSYKAPYWVKLVRSGNTYSGYFSADGVNWTQEGTSRTFTMNSTLYVGLAVTSHDDGNLCTAVFSNISGDIQMQTSEVIDKAMITVRFSPTSVQDYKYARLAIGSNDPGLIAYVDLEGIGVSQVKLGTRQVGGVGGPANTIADYGNDILLGQGAMLVLLDTSGPGAPQKIKQIRLDGVIEAIAVQDDVAYAALGNKGIAVVDLTNFKPLPGTLTLETSGFASGIVCNGNYLCVADGIAGVNIYDVSSPLAPIYIDSVETNGAAVSVEINNNNLFILDDAEGIYKVQLASTAILGSFQGFEFGKQIVSSGAVLYAVDSLGSLIILDAMTNTPAKLSEILLQIGSAYDIQVKNDIAYITGQNGLEIINVSNPSSPETITVYPALDNPQGLVIKGTEAYIANGINGLTILDIQNPESVSILPGNIPGFAPASVSSSSTDSVVFAGNGQNLVSYNLTDSSEPSVNDIYEYLDQAEDIAIEGQYAYIAAGNSGLQIVDLTNPSGNSAEYPLNGFVSSVAVNGTIALVSASDSVHVLDISSPVSPLPVDTINTTGWVTDVAAGSTYGYFTEQGNGISVIDLASAQYAGTTTVAGQAYALALDNNYIYAACGTEGIAVLDITDPANPSIASQYDLPGLIVDVAIVEGKLCAADATKGVSILDISTPTNPVLYANASTSSPAFHIASAGSRIFAADTKGGLAVLGVTGWPNDNIGDISGNSLVDIEDLAILSWNWLENETNLESLPANINYYDTNISMPDFSVLADTWQSEYQSNNNLIAYLKFNETNGQIAYDSSPNKHNGSLYNMDESNWIMGQSGNSLYFNGQNSYLQINNFPGIGQSESRTFTAFIKTEEDLNNSDTNIRIIASWGKADGSDPNRKWVIFIDDQTGQLALESYGTRLNGGPDLEDGNWHHIAVVLPEGSNNINQVRLYVDGSDVQTNAASLNAVINTELTEDVLIGAIDLDPAPGIQTPQLFFNGSIDDVRFYNAELTEEQILNLSLVVYLQFNQNTGIYAIDSSDFNNNARLINGPTRTSSGEIHFDGIDDFIQIENYSGIGSSNSRTVAAWLQADEDLANNDRTIRTILSWGNLDSSSFWAFILDEVTGQLALDIYGTRLKGGPDLEDGQWHHVAVVLPEGVNNIDQVKLYVDGIEVQTNANSLNATINTSISDDVLIGAVDTEPTIGTQTPAFLFKGLLDEIRIYSIGIPASEISQLANR